ncbi:MAG: nucleoside hydrolase [Chloroflexi bacterium]|nr:nucleoside hydrolase [Chloroflexota bacterium]MCL5074052.1 nucleoside hydrolase [Chloroflexota bacterium]
MRRFLIDTDTASDDAVALLMAVRSPHVRVEGVTVVAGNVPLQQAVKNALNTLELAGVNDVPVYPGLAKPLLRDHVDATDIHGPDGMGNLQLPAPRLQPRSEHAVDAIIRIIRSAPGEITLVTLGPLSNIALALRKEPRIAQEVKEVYVMGGTAQTLGNITPAAEYNIWCDPEAARIVFHSGMPLMMVGWELAIGPSLLNTQEIESWRALDTPLAHFAIDCNRQVIECCRRLLGSAVLSLPDPVTMAVALDHHVATKVEKRYVDVEITSELTRGQTVVDLWGMTSRAPNVEVCLAIDSDRFKQMLRRLVA